jgi:hypothetical protein
MRCATAPLMPHPGCSENDLVRIRAAGRTELAFLQAIDRAAGRMFAGIGMPEVARHHWWQVASPVRTSPRLP